MLLGAGAFKTQGASKAERDMELDLVVAEKIMDDKNCPYNKVATANTTSRQGN
ncbi:MAG: hypothetical protein OQL20_04955 [Sedimenticola sp.]|nr:hypothetical protein [Sedimenticola sp.]